MCQTHKMRDDSHIQMTELGYIIHERLSLSKSPDLVHCLCDALKQDSKQHVCCLIHCLMKFDPSILPKIILHAMRPADSLEWSA
jgi:hypothetical protein